MKVLPDDGAIVIGVVGFRYEDADAFSIMPTDITKVNVEVDKGWDELAIAIFHLFKSIRGDGGFETREDKVAVTQIPHTSR